MFSISPEGAIEVLRTEFDLYDPQTCQFLNFSASKQLETSDFHSRKLLQQHYGSRIQYFYEMLNPSYRLMLGLVRYL